MDVASQEKGTKDGWQHSCYERCHAITRGIVLFTAPNQLTVAQGNSDPKGENPTGSYHHP